MALIYCVEDDDGIRELISCALRSGGYEVKAFPKAKPFYEALVFLWKGKEHNSKVAVPFQRNTRAS